MSCAIDSNWLLQKSPGLNLECFGDIKSFSEKKKKKLKTCCYKVTVQKLYLKPEEKKLDDNFLYTVCHLF